MSILYPFVGVWKQSVAPVIEPVSLEEAKAQSRIVSDADDELIRRLIKVARTQFEEETGRQCCRATWTLKLDGWPDAGVAIELPRPPAVSVSSITYVDSNGATQTLASSVYSVSTQWEPGKIRLAYNQSWPALRGIPEAVTITYLAGYATAAEVPENWRHAILMLVSDIYENDAANIVIQGGAFAPSKAWQSLVNSSRWH